MRLYRLIVADRPHYVGTQADARALKRETSAAWSEVEVPTDKAGLIAFLNEIAAAAPPLRVATLPQTLEPAPITAPLPTLAPSHPLDAGSILARLDNPDLGIDAIVEGIARMKGGYALKRVAGAVAIRFEELSR